MECSPGARVKDKSPQRVSVYFGSSLKLKAHVYATLGANILNA